MADDDPFAAAMAEVNAARGMSDEEKYAKARAILGSVAADLEGVYQTLSTRGEFESPTLEAAAREHNAFAASAIDDKERMAAALFEADDGTAALLNFDDVTIAAPTAEQVDEDALLAAFESMNNDLGGPRLMTRTRGGAAPSAVASLPTIQSFNDFGFDAVAAAAPDTATFAEAEAINNASHRDAGILFALHKKLKDKTEMIARIQCKAEPMRNQLGELLAMVKNMTECYDESHPQHSAALIEQVKEAVAASKAAPTFPDTAFSLAVLTLRDISQDALDEVLADTRPMAVEETEQSRMAGRLVPHLRAITDTATEAVQARTAADAQARIVDIVNTLKTFNERLEGKWPDEEAALTAAVGALVATLKTTTTFPSAALNNEILGFVAAMQRVFRAVCGDLMFERLMS